VVKKSRNKWIRAPKYAIAIVVLVNLTDMARLIIVLMNSFTRFLDNTYKKMVDVIKAKINEWVIPLCAKIKSCGANIPVRATKILSRGATKMVSKSSEIPPKAPASLFLLLIAVKIM
jgi:hypothetical protein